MFLRTRLLPLLIGIFLCATVGCVRTIQPILKDDQLTTDSAVVGKWVSADGKTTLDVKPIDEDSRSYKVNFTDEKQKTGVFVVRLGKVNDLLIAEIRPDDPAPDASDTYKAHIMPLYSFLVLHQTKPDLIVSSLSIDWMKKYIASNPNELDVVHLGPDDFLLNSSTADFQAFLLKHYSDPEAMGEKTTFKRP